MTGGELEALALGRSLRVGGGGGGARVRFATVRAVSGGRAVVEIDGGRVELPDASGMGAGAVGMRCAVLMDGAVGVVVGVVNDAAAGGGDYLPLAGGTLTGPVVTSSGSIDEGASPASTKYGSGYGMAGATGTRNANLQLEQSTDGTIWLREEARRSVGGTLKYNNLKVGVDVDGNPVYFMSSPAAFRSAAGACSSDCITAAVSQRTALTTSQLYVPLAAAASSGSGFSISDGKVKCGFSGRVLVSAAAFFRYPDGDASAGSDNPKLFITVDGTDVADMDVIVPGAWGGGASLPPRLVQVSNGSLIGCMAVNYTAARGELSATASNYLTVQRVS